MQAGTGGGGGGLLGRVTFVSSTYSLILAGSRVATSPEQHIPAPTQANNSDIQEHVAPRPALGCQESWRRSLPHQKGPKAPSCSEEGTLAALALAMGGGGDTQA